MQDFTFQNLGNGLTLVRDLRSGLTGLYTTTTRTYHSGDLRNDRLVARAMRAR